MKSTKRTNIHLIEYSRQGINGELKQDPYMKDKIKWGGYYIIAPENGCSGTVNPNDWEDKSIWQYGSNLGIGTNNGEDPRWEQDGVAPQCAVGGLNNDNRAFIPPIVDFTKSFDASHSIENYKWIFNIQPNLSNGQSNGYIDKK